MKSRIQWCKNFVTGVCLGVTRGQKVGFWVSLFDCQTNLSQVIALLMRTGGTHWEFWCVRGYVMVLAQGYAIAHHRLALVFLTSLWMGIQMLDFVIAAWLSWLLLHIISDLKLLWSCVSKMSHTSIRCYFNQKVLIFFLFPHETMKIDVVGTNKKRQDKTLLITTACFHCEIRNYLSKCSS